MLAVTAAEARDFSLAPKLPAEVDCWLEDIGKRLRIEERLLFRARVCISELISNALEHGQAQLAAGDIRLELRHNPPFLELELINPGAPFDPTLAPPIEADEDRVGGLGLRLVRAYAQTMKYRRAADRNFMTLSFAPPS